MVKIIVLLFLFYTLFVKKIKGVYMIMYVFILLTGILCAYLSHYYSRKCYGSSGHMIFHVLLHTFGLLGVLFAFI